jgi:hypothetical protein
VVPKVVGSSPIFHPEKSRVPDKMEPGILYNRTNSFNINNFKLSK